jgi:hypothetical protein
VPRREERTARCAAAELLADPSRWHCIEVGAAALPPELRHAGSGAPALNSAALNSPPAIRQVIANIGDSA